MKRWKIYLAATAAAAYMATFNVEGQLTCGRIGCVGALVRAAIWAAVTLACWKIAEVNFDETE